MNTDLLTGLVDTIKEHNYDIHSVTIIRNGYLVLDEYFSPFEANSRHILYSCTKSIVSVLIGIAIDEGYIESVNQSVLDLFPEQTAANLDANKQAMTLEHVLTMSSGLECRDSYLYRWRGLNEMQKSDDWVQFMLDLPMAEPPGTRFEYCNGGSFLLSAIIQETTGMSALEFAREHLFGPLDISDVHWPANPAGITIGWGNMYMRPHDMAKIGYLYLNGGQWEGEQVVPAAWVKASTQAHVAATLSDGYGYQWWVDDGGYYMAQGYYGQFIYVVPEKDMVVVFTSELDEEDFFIPETLLNEYIIPAVEARTTPPADTPAPPSLSDTRTRPADGMAMVHVPAGTFQMGSTDDEVGAEFFQCEQAPVNRVYCERKFYEYESPQHSVTLDGFWIDQTEVTNAQYTLCVADGDCKQSRLANDTTYNGDDYPVAGIPWQDAADYCTWAGGRLPTEAEWEYAARGTRGHIYPWGNEFDCASGNFGDDFTGCDDGYAHTAPVATFGLTGASWCGALDMAGNVWEWVADWHGDYSPAAQTNPTGPTEGDLNILRGGSWGYGLSGVRAAYRYPVPPDADYLGMGFRCVIPAEASLSEETATLASLEQVDDYPLYTMRYYGDYNQRQTAVTFPEAQKLPGKWACSLFAALGDADNMFYGRNFDWEYSPALLLFTDPPDGYASVSMVDIAYLVNADKISNLTDLPLNERRPLLAAPFWPFDGMNEHGLVIGLAAVPPGNVPPDPDKQTAGSLDMLREVLDHARDVDEAVAILQNYNIDWEGGPALHYLVADRSGRSILVEFYQGETVLIPNGEPWHLATNFLRASAGESAEGECWRYDGIRERLVETEGRLTALGAMDILAQVSQDGTQWSVVYGMSSGDVSVTMGREYDTAHTFQFTPTKQAAMPRGGLIRADPLHTYSPHEVSQILAFVDAPLPFQPAHSVQAMRLLYQTVDPHGHPVQASGALIVPVGVENPSLLSLQHGTETRRDGVASVNPINSVEGVAGLLLASQGYVVCIPDYIGLGESELLHPYLHAESLATAVIDMLRAAQAYSRENGVSLGEGLFLTGYSEGGFATLAAYREMELHYGDEFQITAVEPIAGPYDLVGTVQTLFQQPAYDWPAYLAYFFTAYDQVYGWNRLGEMFNAPHGEKLPDLFDGEKSFSEINDQLPTTIFQLLNSDFVASALDGHETALNAALKENTLLDWTPSAPVRFCHGDADQVTPYQHALTAVERLRENGGTEIELITIKGGSHEMASLACVLDMMVWFDEFQ